MEKKRDREQERKTTAAASTQKAEVAPQRCGWTLTYALFPFSCIHLQFVSSHHHQEQQLYHHRCPAAAALLDPLSQHCTGATSGNKGKETEEEKIESRAWRRHHLPDLQTALISEERESLTGL